MTTKQFEIGGVMRCCLATLGETEVKDEEGELVKCKHCEHGFILKDDVWRKWWGAKIEKANPVMSKSVKKRLAIQTGQTGDNAK